MPNHSLNYPASAMLKSAAPNYKPNAEYTSYDNSAAQSLLEHIESNIGIRRDAQDAHKREWQLRCVSEYNHTHNNKMLRVLVVNGAMTMFALTKAIAQAFGLTDKPYNPQPSKGTLPPGSHWQLNMLDSDADKAIDFINSQMAGLIGNQKNVFKAAGKGAPFFDEKKMKVYQLFRKRGDTLVFRCTGCGGEQKQVTVRLDGYEQSSTDKKAWRTPRCVGADRRITKPGWNFLNSQLLQNKQDRGFSYVLFCGNLTQAQQQDALNNRFKVPLFDNRGKAIGKSSAGFEEIKELHRVVALPFAP